MARERNSRPSSREEAYRWDKRTRQSAPRLEIRSCVRSTGDLSIDSYQLSGLFPWVKVTKCSALLNGIGVGILLYRGSTRGYP